MNRRDFLVGSLATTIATSVRAADSVAKPPATTAPVELSEVEKFSLPADGLFAVKPHLQLLGEHSAAVVWLTRRKATGYVEWSQHGGATCNVDWTEEDEDMNRQLGRIGAAIVSVTVFLFAVCLMTDFIFGSYFVCMLLPLGWIMTAAALQRESGEDRRAAANVGLVLSGVYTVLILLVYFAQTTSVRLDGLNGQAAGILDFRRGGLIFNYDLLGYGMMALSTFFMGLAFRGDGSGADRWLKRLLLIHGAFFPGCFLLPMTGVFRSMASGETGGGGTLALIAWCAYFLPVGILAFLHFRKKPAGA